MREFEISDEDFLELVVRVEKLVGQLENRMNNSVTQETIEQLYRCIFEEFLSMDYSGYPAVETVQKSCLENELYAEFVRTGIMVTLTALAPLPAGESNDQTS